MLLFWIMYHIVVSDTETSVRATNEYKLNQVISHVDDCMKNIIDESAALTSADLMDLDFHQIDTYERYLIQKDLRELISRSGIFYDAGIYYKSGGGCLSADSEYRALDFNNRFVTDPYIYSQQLTSLFQSNAKILLTSVLRDAKDQTELVTIFVRYPITEKNPERALYVMITKENFDHLLADILDGEGKENILILDRDKRLLYASHTPEESVTKYIRSGKWTRQPHDKIEAEEKKIAGETYIISCKESSYVNADYLILVPKREYFHLVYWVRNVAMMFFVLALFIGIGVIYLAMRANYHPIRRAYEKAVKWIDNTEDSDDELEVINRSFDLFSQREREFEEGVSISQAVKRNELLLRLLRTDINPEEFLRDADSLDLDLRRLNYRVIIISIHSKTIANANRREIEAWLKRHYRNYFSGIYVNLYDDCTFPFLVCMSDTKKLLSGLKKMQKELAEVLGVVCCIGMGRNYHEPESVKKSFMESTTALSYYYVYGENSIIEFEGLNIEKGYYTIDISKELENLKTLFVGRDRDVTANQIRLISRKIKESGASIIAIRRAAIEMVSTVSGWVGEWEQSEGAGGTAGGTLAYLSMDAVLSAETLDEIKEMLINICTYLYEEQESGNKTVMEGSGMMERMLSYINQNCYDAGFSIKQMAADFDMTQPYLSQRFKVMTGQTISSYVSKKRIERAKELLITTDALVNDIIQQIGYYDVSSFLRKFKQSEGITPGAYREKYRR